MTSRSTESHLVTDFIFDLVLLLLGHLVAAADENCPGLQLPRREPSPPAAGKNEKVVITWPKKQQKTKTKAKKCQPEQNAAPPRLVDKRRSLFGHQLMRWCTL